MTAKEAFDAIIAKIENPEEYDEHISVLTEAISGNLAAESNKDYQRRYEDLRDKYTRRFGEMLEHVEEESRPTKEPEDTLPEAESYADLDFDGSTE